MFVWTCSQQICLDTHLKINSIYLAYEYRNESSGNEHDIPIKQKLGYSSADY